MWKQYCSIIMGVLIMMMNNSCNSAEVNVTVTVVTPSSTPRDAQLYIAGNHSLIGDWNPGQVKMTKQSDSVWTISFKLPKDLFFEFKITRGTWNTQAIYVGNEIPPNTHLTVSHDTAITLHPLSWRDIDFAFTENIVGTVKYHRAMKGDGLNHPRDVIVWFPPSYDKDSLRRYPVLYMHDGQNVFDPSTSFIGYDWHVDEVADSLIKTGKMNEVIVVGIYNTPERADEYGDTKLGRAYMRFLVEKVKPMIDSMYRTLPDRENTAVMGSSMGGLMSFLLIWNYPEIFSMAGCLSPVFREPLIRSVAAYEGADKKIKIYMDNGGVGLDDELQKGCDGMLQALYKIGFLMNGNLVWYKDSTAEHNERAWAARVWRPLTFMFGK
jgi:predicted alpha/beta superfamily hydrolase